MDQLDRLHRIIILGRPGSGKSTMARRLGSDLNIPVYHTDALGWKPGWVRTPFPEYRESICGIVERERWIIDGNSIGTFDLRFPVADAIIWLDPPPARSFIRIVLRTVRYLGRTRPGSAPKCKDRFHPVVFRIMQAFDREIAPKIRDAITQYRAEGRVVRLTSVRDIDRLNGSDMLRMMV